MGVEKEMTHSDRNHIHNSIHVTNGSKSENILIIWVEWRRVVCLGIFAVVKARVRVV